jgi:hypothetical protein
MSESMPTTWSKRPSGRIEHVANPERELAGAEIPWGPLAGEVDEVLGEIDRDHVRAAPGRLDRECAGARRPASSTRAPLRSSGSQDRSVAA